MICNKDRFAKLNPPMPETPPLCLVCGKPTTLVRSVHHGLSTIPPNVFECVPCALVVADTPGNRVK